MGTMRNMKKALVVSAVMVLLALIGSAALAAETQVFVTKWGSYGSGDGQFDRPHSIAIGTDGYVYVADSSNNRIQKFTSTGTFVTKWGSYGSEDGQFMLPVGIAVSTDGFVYVAEQNNPRVQKFTSTGTFVTKWGSYGSGDGQFVNTGDVAVDSSGSVYVADSGNHRIQKFTSTGTFIIKWGSYGSGDGEFVAPHGVAVDSTGYVYVANTYDHNIQKFISGSDLITALEACQSQLNACCPPTSISLSSFQAIPFNEKVTLQWKTESEVDNAGFNLWRAEFKKINNSLIPAKGSSTQGASYQFIDNNVQNRQMYLYKLEDIDLSGKSIMHDPVGATPRAIYNNR